MSEEKKWREFWLTWFESGRGQIQSLEATLDSVFYSYKHKYGESDGVKPVEVRHVIEIGALKELYEEIAFLEKRIERYENSLRVATQYLDSCGYDDEQYAGTPEQEMLFDFREALKAGEKG